MNNQTTGIVIDQIDYKDNDAIITVYSKDYQKISLYVKGYKKITSKNVYATQLFDESEFLFDYKESSSFQLLKSATLKNEYAPIKADYLKLSVASVIAELSRLIEEEDLYDLLKQSFDLLSTTSEPYTILNLFLAAVLKLAGIEPFVDGCTNCGSEKQIETISVDNGGFICHNCNQHIHEKIYSVEMLKKFRIINKANYQVADKLTGIGINDFELTKILMEFMSTYLDISLKSYKSLVSLNK